MGLLDEFEAFAGQELAQNGGGDTAKVAGGLVQALQEHPGGLQGILDTLKQNGLDEHVQNWTAGQGTPATPDQVQQGLSGTGLIEAVAAKAGVSPEIAQMAMTTVLPMVVSHFAPNGEVAGESQFGGLAQQLLSRFL
ncbi:DUF937 domain-containing protein [Granulicella sp. WH15]|uniref:YidB family protein n=1 Tax=Granulicella sp. WH15 TaxID=2602070 RepID=UPI001366CDEA|nr:YidB family protein [Granulicella sp. WH15]QHN05140.1 DUF937 domain-containing protein [Granulicella sp. WH15]